jgi:hypothetical protein
VAHSDDIDALAQGAVAQLREDVRTIIQRLRVEFASLLARMHTPDGKVAGDDFNLELAAKLEAGWSGILEDAGYDGALGELLTTYEEIADANGVFIEDRLGRSFSRANLRALGRVASGGVDRLIRRGEGAGEALREILVVAGHSNARVEDVLHKLTAAASISLDQAVIEAQTLLMAFHRDGIAVESFEAGIDLFTYDGPDDGIIRPFCSRFVGMIVTAQDLDEEDNGDQPRPVSRFLGGWRCRHSLSPLSFEEAAAMVEEQGASIIAPGMTLARQILLRGKEGPAARAFRLAHAGEVVNGKRVRAGRAA